ncbi:MULTISPECIES: MATE family efflux transporter [unclassified Paenibacillus]|uniref:MATE family efflux transporter n=1 Tax=unclassified Paenibacillus TaxID=185978 RepID=UPI0030D4C2BD
MNKLEKKQFYNQLLKLAVPISLQSLVMAVLYLVDQLMVGQLGGVAIASVGMASKIYSVISVVLAGLATGLAIYAAQYWGSKDRKSITPLLGLSLGIGLILSGSFTIFVFFNPRLCLSIFTTDKEVLENGYIFLKIVALSYIPTMLTMLYSAVLRSSGHVKYPMIVSIAAVGMNIILNYALIFGHWGFPELGLAGAAYATLISRIVESALIVGAVYRGKLPGAGGIKELSSFSKALCIPFLRTIAPIVLTELVWVLGEACYSVIYSRMGTAEMTAMTVTFPLQGLTIGLLAGLSGAAGIMVGHKLGENNNAGAFQYARFFVRIGVGISLLLGVLIAVLAPLYVSAFNLTVEERRMATSVICFFALFLWIKVGNMMIAGGILQSGGDSKFVFIMEGSTTWLLGVPLGLLLSWGWKQPLPWVYFFLSLEEAVRLVIGYVRFRRGKWLKQLTHQGTEADCSA